MTVKMTVQGGLIYLTLVFFVATIIARRGGWRTIGNAFWGTGFVAAVASVIWRGLHTGHPPMQNLFEFFLCMAAALWPLSVLSRRHNGLDTTVQDALLGVLILIPAGFVFGEDVRRLPPALQSSLFIPHVGSYVAGYVLMARAALMALRCSNGTSLAICCARRRQPRQTATIGFVLLTLIVAGSRGNFGTLLAVRPQRDVVARGVAGLRRLLHERMAHWRARGAFWRRCSDRPVSSRADADLINLSRLFVGA